MKAQLYEELDTEMLRFVVKEVYVGHVVHANGMPETHIYTIDGDIAALENLLRYADQPKGERPDYLTRELVGVELLEIHSPHE